MGRVWRYGPQGPERRREVTAPLLAPLIEPRVVRLTLLAVNKEGEILGPVTKKNSPVLIPRQKFPTLVPSPQYRAWESACLRSLKVAGIIRHHGDQWIWLHSQAIDYPVNCCAVFYREANVGDACNFYQSVGDLLQKAGIVANDKFLVAWDGSRLLKDARRPRVEITLTEVVE